MSSTKNKKLKIVVSMLLINMLFSVSMSFAYWASLISGDNVQGAPVVTIGDWGVPIFTTTEFFDMATDSSSNPADRYYLANDIDFTGFSWIYDAAIYNSTFKGELNGNNKIISNLTINNPSLSYLHMGIFARVDGARVSNLTLDNVQLETNLSGTSQRAGLFGGTAIGGTIVFENIVLNNCGVQGTSAGGVGGLLGQVRNSGTVVAISSIKVNNLKVFNQSSNVGGLVGRINADASVVLSDIDFLGDVYSNIVTSAGSSNAGGLVGYVLSGGFLSIERAIVESTFQNTLVTTSNYLGYSNRYLGGMIGRNSSVGSNVTITNSFFTGSLYTRLDIRNSDVGTVTGNDLETAVLSGVFYSYVAYRDTGGGITYTATGQTGQMSTVVSATSMPSHAWWDSAYTTLNAANPLWTQEPVSGRVYLDL
ncbi:MAG: hypothetical protein KKH01_08580 [Firmicutes bacterium]|nr:hypothetical protein [Bacillota bacterium]